MVGWARWINYINPVAYGFEAIMVNEFHNRNFTCSTFVPFGGLYNAVPAVNKACVAIGSVLGQNTVNGDVYLASAFGYYNSHKWRNVGIMFVFLAFAGVMQLKFNNKLITHSIYSMLFMAALVVDLYLIKE